ncbi:hypothetical protein Cgig2_032162 [Carnegiea gigantea]|uniref:J domain-containing protein n=1 Tax=Carnegiea gigantea TaxID=171969 RepID=A0A9Q1GVG0_9CARY|nr:hypothetical protein Cgig2_032162 [Carnegiea gigantea]
MADHYRVLGLMKTATKEDIKEAFRRLAIQFHPDKHAQSSKSARDAATLKFKQVSEAYEILIDDRKRAAYNLSRRSCNNGGNFYSAASGSYGYNNANGNANYYYDGGGSYYKNSNQTTSSSISNRWASNLDAALRYMTTREFLRNFVFASSNEIDLIMVVQGAFNTNGTDSFSIQAAIYLLLSFTVERLLLAGTVAIDISGDTLWKMHNTGKSFEEAVESVQKNKAHRDKE